MNCPDCKKPMRVEESDKTLHSCDDCNLCCDGDV